MNVGDTNRHSRCSTLVRIGSALFGKRNYQ